MAALYVAHGTRGVAKLVESLSDPSLVGELAANLTTLNSLLSSQESKMRALANDGAVMPVLTGLISSSEAEVRRQAALAIASLTLVYQGRLAAADAATTAALAGPLREDGSETVRAACAAALQSLTSSRDGCSVVMQADGIVSRLTAALDDEHKAVCAPTLAALANTLRLDLGVDEALSAGVVAKLARLTGAAQRDLSVLETGLQALWNLANTPAGKAAAIEASVLPLLAEHLDQQPSHNVQRLAAGCVLAITIDKDGKLAALPCITPLCRLLFSPGCSPEAMRDVIGALKNITESPKARRLVDAWVKENNKGDEMASIFEQKPFDHKQWPASIRFQHQNVAPGGVAAAHEAATRERWGYPRPFDPSPTMR